MQVSLPDRGATIAPPTTTAGDWLRRAMARWEHPGWSALLAIVVYAAIAALHGGMWHASEYAYFNYLADAFLNGRLDLRLRPESIHDLSYFNGRYYLYWPPFPAILLMPFVALFGINFSDILFTVVVGGLDVALIAILLRSACRGRIVTLTPLQRSLLVIGFAFGSAHMALAPYGRVWYTAQLIGFACVALAYLAAINLRGWRAFLMAGLALAAALLTRNHLVLAGVWPAYYLLLRHWPLRWRRLIGYAALGLLPIVVAVGSLALYNWMRFGSPLDNGLAYHRMSPFFRSDYERYGAFNLHYLPINLYYQFIAYPFPWRGVASSLGGSLFLLSPLFFAAFWGLAAGRPRASVWALAVSILLVAVPILLLMGTGWRQFGPRYTLDFTVPLLLLTAIGVRRWPTWLLALSVALGIVQYAIGAVLLGAVI